MCDIFGWSLDQTVKIPFVLEWINRYGEMNPHGWGTAFEGADGNIRMVKEHCPPRNSCLLKVMEFVETSVGLAHVRFATHGKKIWENTHPFVASDRGQEWAFCHNGVLHNAETPERYFPAGDTDSEWAFCLLMDWIAKFKMDFAFFEKKMGKINKDGSANFVLVSGGHLFAYSDKSGYNNLSFREVKRGGVESIVVTTKPVSDGWAKIPGGKLLVAKDGKIIY